MSIFDVLFLKDIDKVQGGKAERQGGIESETEHYLRYKCSLLNFPKKSMPVSCLKASSLYCLRKFKKRNGKERIKIKKYDQGRY